MKKTAGFTLIEMAVVVLIIGVILAGVMKGRDIVRGAQTKQFTQGFVQNWVATAANYYGRTGQRLGDGDANGGTDAAGPDGRLDFFYLGDESQGDASKNADRVNIDWDLQNVGIDLCEAVKSKLNSDTSGICSNGFHPFSTIIEGEFVGASVAGVGFHNWDVGPPGGGVNRNVMTFINVPTDVAVGLDTSIDGTADGQNGKCLNLTNGGFFTTQYPILGNVLHPPGGGLFPATPLAWPNTIDTGSGTKVVVGIIVE